MARVRRNPAAEGVEIPRGVEIDPDAPLQVGDRVEVKRVTNNPYLVLIGKEPK